MRREAILLQQNYSHEITNMPLGAVMSCIPIFADG